MAEKPNPGAEGKSSGKGAVAPLGNGMGATQSAGAYSGAHDFIKDPASGADASGGRDFTKESRPQPGDQAPQDINPQSIPAGGKLPFPAADPKGERAKFLGTIVDAERKQPFRLKGE